MAQMGIADRDYHRNHSPRGSGFLAQLPPVVKGLLIANVGIYFLDLFLGKFLRYAGAFTIDSAIFHAHLWEFLTFQFLHGGIGQLFFNSMGLFFLGPWMERWWGSRKFLTFYLLCGIAGACFYSLLYFAGIIVSDPGSPLIGASAGIYGIFIGVAVIAPEMRVALLFPPIELSMRQLALGLMAISAGSILLKLGGNTGGEAGHLGGAILGFLLVRHAWLLDFMDDRSTTRSPKATRAHQPKLRPRTTLIVEQESAVDQILDKISSDGFQSLTQEERNILDQASKSDRSQ
jgi:membrane associated rhomboid family serine protease